MTIKPIKARKKVFSPTTTPLSFEVCGIEFEALPDLDYRVYENTVAQLSAPDENGKPVDMITKMHDNIREFLLDDENRERWDELLASDAIVPVSTSNEIWSYLLVEYKVIDAPKN